MGLLFQEGFPAILANDVAGEVIKLGSGPLAATFTTGEHIFGQSSLTDNHTLCVDNSGLQEYAHVDVRYAARVPATGLSDDETVTFPTNIVPVWVAFFHLPYFGFPDPYHPDAKTVDFMMIKTVLIVDGGSNIGRLSTKVAKFLGFGRTVVVAGKPKERERAQRFRPNPRYRPSCR